MQEAPQIERHPLRPFMPENAVLLTRLPALDMKAAAYRRMFNELPMKTIE